MALDPKRTVAELKELRALDRRCKRRAARRVDRYLAESARVVRGKLAGCRSSITTTRRQQLGHARRRVRKSSAHRRASRFSSQRRLARRRAQRSRRARNPPPHQRRIQRPPPVTMRLVDWADEEGARFGRSLLGSSAFAGTASIAADRVRTDRDGTQMEDALRRCGVEMDRFPEATHEQKERRRLHRAAHRAGAGA